MEDHITWHSFLFKVYFALISIIFFGYCNRSVIGDDGKNNHELLIKVNVLGCCFTGILSPMMVAPVCLGDPLQITCTAPVEFLRWSILRLNEQGTFEKITNDVIMNSRDPNQMIQTRVNSTTVTFTRTSSQGASPLTSTLSVESVRMDLNEKVVRCMDIENPMTSASTTIQIFEGNQSELATST